MKNNISLALKLKAGRNNLNLSQEYVGELLNLTSRQIDDIENNKRDISNNELKLLCEIYGYSINDIITEKKHINTKFSKDFLQLPKRKKEIFTDILKKID